MKILTLKISFILFAMMCFTNSAFAWDRIGSRIVSNPEITPMLIESTKPFDVPVTPYRSKLLDSQ